MADEKAGSSQNRKPQPVEEKEPVHINLSQYRSMILSKLRADIEAKQAAYEIAKTASLAVLKDMTYWKMKYWKMKYWKMGSSMLPEEVEER